MSALEKEKKKKNETNLPDTNDFDEKITGEAGSKHLRYDKHVGSQRRLQHNRHVRGIEQLDRIRPSLSTELVALHRNLDTESLEINNDGENNDSRNQIHDIRETFSPERFT